MTTDTLQDYETLIDGGFSEEQSRAVVRIIAPHRNDPEILNGINLILERLDQIEERLDKLEEGNRNIREDLTNLSARVQILEDRIRTESRVTRLINTTLIALGALAATLASILTR